MAQPAEPAQGSGHMQVQPDAAAELRRSALNMGLPPQLRLDQKHVDIGRTCGCGEHSVSTEQKHVRYFHIFPP